MSSDVGTEGAAEIAFVWKVMRRSGRSIALESEAPRFIAVFLMLTGLGFIVHGALESSSRSQLFLIGAGVVFSLFGIGAYRLWRRYRDSDA